MTHAPSFCTSYARSQAVFVAQSSGVIHYCTVQSYYTRFYKYKRYRPLYKQFSLIYDMHFLDFSLTVRIK